MHVAEARSTMLHMFSATLSKAVTNTMDGPPLRLPLASIITRLVHVLEDQDQCTHSALLASLVPIAITVALRLHGATLH